MGGEVKGRAEEERGSGGGVARRRTNVLGPPGKEDCHVGPRRQLVVTALNGCLLEYHIKACHGCCCLSSTIVAKPKRCRVT